MNDNLFEEAGTFGDLFGADGEDFNLGNQELEDSKKVSWTVEYGTIRKQISSPKDTIIAELKMEIETSKEFLEALKKAKDKSPACKIKPVIRAQSKGVASYKGVFATMVEAEQSDKFICILPGKDGKVYEMRRNQIGKFITQSEGISEISAGFIPTLPLIPFDLLCQVIGFFRHFMSGEQEFEAMVHVYWDTNNKEYHISAPQQFVERAHISAEFNNDFDAQKYIHVANIHSHNSMPAVFSAVDDLDEQPTRVYIVIERLNQYFPEISARISNGGRYLPIQLSTIIENLPNEFPKDWLKSVTYKRQSFFIKAVACNEV